MTRRINEKGFTVTELVVVLAIAIMAAGFAVPNILAALHSEKLRGTGSDFSGILQSGRIRAVQDNRFYSIYFSTGAAQQAYVDIYPQNANGVSGNQGSAMDPKDPAIVVPAEVSVMGAGSAPDTAILKGLFLPTGSSLPVNDGSSISSPITFSPHGLPCTEQIASAVSGVTTTTGTVCDSAGGATAFWVFFQNKLNQQWEAVTVSPSGRIQKWSYNQGWAKIA